MLVTWDNSNFTWDKKDHSWENIVDVIERPRVGWYSEYVEGNPWNKLNDGIIKEKSENLLKVYCKINNIDYGKSLEKTSNVKVRASGFGKLIKEGISVKVKL